MTQQQWGTLLAHSAWITLAADFVLATRNDPVQHQVHRDTIDAFTAGVRMLILAQAATLDVAVEDDDLLERAATALLATGVGLAVEHALGAIDLDRATATFIDSVELWFRRLDPSP